MQLTVVLKEKITHLYHKFGLKNIQCFLLQWNRNLAVWKIGMHASLGALLCKKFKIYNVLYKMQQINTFNMWCYLSSLVIVKKWLKHILLTGGIISSHFDKLLVIFTTSTQFDMYTVTEQLNFVPNVWT